MKLIQIIGDSAVGKMTVGQELAKRTGYTMMHNHVAIEPVVEMFGYFDKTAVNDVRRVLIQAACRGKSGGLIFTYMFDFARFPENFEYYKWIISTMQDALPKDEDVDVYTVELDATLQTRLLRNKTENRLRFKRSKRNLKDSTMRLLEDYRYGRFESHYYELRSFGRHLRLVNDHLSVDEQVSKIMDYYGFVPVCTKAEAAV